MHAHAGSAGKRIALSNNFGENAWRRAMIEDFREAGDHAVAQGLVAEVSAFTTVNNQVAEQAFQIENLILQRYDAIVVNATSPDGLNDVVRKACTAGIVVVSFDGTVTEFCAWRLHVDFQRLGREQIEFLARFRPEGGRVLELRGPEGSPIDEAISAGIHEGLDAYPQFTLVETVRGDWNETASKRETSALLADRDLAADFVVTQASEGYGAIEAHTGRGKPLPVVMLGASRKELDWWQSQRSTSGYETFSVSIPPGISRLAFHVARMILDGQEVPKDLTLPLLTVTADGLSEALNIASSKGQADAAYTIDDAVALLPKP